MAATAAFETPRGLIKALNPDPHNPNTTKINNREYINKTMAGYSLIVELDLSEGSVGFRVLCRS